MNVIAIVDKYLQARYLFFKWRYELTIAKKLILAFSMACVTGLLAQIYIYLPFTPVPFTGQVLGVLLSGVLCGATYGAMSQAMYLGLGIAGIPWFAGKVGGLAIFSQPSCGYILGFIVAAFVIGRYTDRYIRARSFVSQLGLMMIGVGIIYIFGLPYLAFSIGTGLLDTIVKGVVPFIIGDLLKAGISAGISASILPKASYNGEVDKLRYSDRKY
ncbi:MAG: biotin transporter BioY [bacterium]|nr:biotin transporter BioY [bacterium]